MMLLKDLLAPWFHYAGAESIDELVLDSRQASQGKLFVALPGYQVDGRNFIEQAINSGASAVLTHTDQPDEHSAVEYKLVEYSHVEQKAQQIPVISFFQLNRQLSAIAAQFYQVSTQSINVIGITGTNGKTSVNQIIAQLIEASGQKAAVMGTLGNGPLGELVESGNTTADAITVMRQLAEFSSLGCSTCAMEVSSHGLSQGRVEAVPFSTAVFTNLSRDHLDFHGDMQSYGAAKKRLFSFPHVRHGVINADDDIGKKWLNELSDRGYQSYSLINPNADYFCDAIHYHNQGVSARLHYRVADNRRATIKLNTALLGAFNLANVLAAVAALHQQGIEMATLNAAIANVKPVAGRMETFSNEETATIVVDYAHTPDALEQALAALRLHCDGQLWCVFGCGGDRDKGKRPLMARAAEQGADRVVITSDNARSEDPQQIIDDAKQGLSHPALAICEVDRVTAIKRVVAHAKPGDIVLLAGKGHETYQEVAGEKHHYDERALAAELVGGTL
ncbi:UDP-N-acetylmuramoyl-L-alanyl-D-glutamate--2,6-diaminopimelate ligase [Shewanella maritima]|uniref:UDP-N-acetylmuramyl-tripeptide synthetase n=1 Tax=Shewanella maritima TaxID=2520507 RepID=A0A411PIW1_9GAMM|nr:UDP-N-acetylmuramoyl-L-alanyl-D-glutamate--2,6-diaminopimelate ligase [Shewanella maritima]QBF83342.1 UDP-N-acetylmuramoyl-L-alanyl-D-glutamate--2,6-diaminopimelate ligase [Shewanella maritima]